MAEKHINTFDDYKKMKWGTEDMQRNWVDFYTKLAWEAYHSGEENEAIDHFQKARKFSENGGFQPSSLKELEKTIAEMIKKRNQGQ